MLILHWNVRWLVPVLICVALRGTTFAQDSGAQIKPDLTGCTLEIDQQKLKPVETAVPSRREHRTSKWRVTAQKDEVTARQDGRPKPFWVAKSGDGHHLRWLTADGAMAYFQSYRVNGEGRFESYSSPAHIRRLDLETGRWLSDLPVEVKERKGRRTDAILKVLADDRQVAVLSSEVKAVGDGESKVVAYNVTCFPRGQDRPQWSKSFASSGERPEPGVYLLGIRGPDYTESSLTQLTWMGEALLVCAEAVQPILCLDRDTGSTVWKLERPWEFERGFTGPSVWAHHMGRFRTGMFDNDHETVAAARKKFDKEYVCAIVGGPVVVPLTFKRGWLDSHSIFVAVAKGPATGLSGYISDCILYEFNDRGKPVSIAKLPYTVRGAEYTLAKDAVIWKCQNDGLLRIAAAGKSGRMCAAIGGPDMLARIPWFRQVLGLEPLAWLIADRAVDAAAFGQTHAFCIPSGGYISKRDGSVYDFPICAVDFKTGDKRALVLHVPFQGKIPPNATKQQRALDGDLSPALSPAIRKYGPYLLAITGLHSDGSILEITLGMEKWSAALRFDLNVIGSFRPSATQDLEAEQIKKWVKSLGNVNKRGEGGSTPLIDISGDVDVRYVKALLHAGADVKAKTDSGWTALMYAACYGTAEVVETLIAAGSDVNACSENHGKQPVLMWATGGLREQKRKVRALIQAGADPKATEASGWTVLMTAASDGHLSVVEYLLPLGVDVNAQTNEGHTALMSAAEHERPAELVRVLLKAGARVDARNKKGQTALMRAAERGSVEIIKALLDAGADANAKDNQGKTALDVARAPDNRGDQARIRALEAVTGRLKTRK
jgi:ankyrin repeat protein